MVRSTPSVQCVFFDKLWSTEQPKTTW